jgi:hypothetical protein
MKFDICGIPITYRKNQVSLNLTRKTGTLHTHIIISRSVPVRKINISNKTVRKIRTHIFIFNLLKENLDVYEMWKNIIEPDRPPIIIIIIIGAFACWTLRLQAHIRIV